MEAGGLVETGWLVKADRWAAGRVASETREGQRAGGVDGRGVGKQKHREPRQVVTYTVSQDQLWREGLVVMHLVPGVSVQVTLW